MVERRVVAAVTAAAAAAVAVVLTAQPAAGEITSGRCTAQVNSVDITNRSASDPDEAVEIRYDNDAVPVSATSEAPIEEYRVYLEFAGIRWRAAKGTGNGNSWSRTVDVEKYARYGVGLYKVVGSSTGPGACTGAAMVKVTGRSPLSTPVGIAAAVLTGLGVLGTIGAAARGRR